MVDLATTAKNSTSTSTSTPATMMTNPDAGGTEPILSLLPENTYAIMVHKKYADRVRDFLLTPPPEIATSSSSSLRERLFLAPDVNLTENREKKKDDDDQVLLLDTTDLSGVSRNRRGYVVLLLPRIQRPVPSLSPLARQNVSWAGRLSHRLRLRRPKITMDSDEAPAGSNNAISTTTFELVCTKIWNTLQSLGYCCDRNQTYLLRIDVYPRDLAEDISRYLQEAAHESCMSCCNADADKSSCKCDALDPEDPFEGPIVQTKSKSKCTHRLTVTLSSSESCDDYYWGVETRSTDESSTRMLELKLNQEAAEEISVVPCINKTGDEPAAKPGVEYSALPLSRAYYKLEQVWQEYCCAPIENGDNDNGASSSSAVEKKTAWTSLQQGAGLDLGASPGGWTQVLVHKFGLEKVVAVDPGLLAARITNLPGVTHVHSQMETAGAELKSHGPYSVVVCDASMVWMDLLKKLSSHVVPSAEWCLPSLWVVTMKFPFKTLGSIQNHVKSLQDTAAEHLSKMAKAMYPDNPFVRPTYRVVHLMANSDSERTLIAVFDEDHKRPKPNED